MLGRALLISEIVMIVDAAAANDDGDDYDKLENI